MPSEIAFPFRVGADGRVAATSDPDRQAHQHVQALVNTHPEQRAMVPGYGVDLQHLMFEDADDEEIAAQAVTVLSSAFAAWEPGLDLEGVEVRGDDEVSQIDLSYHRKDAADSGTAANTNTAIIGANGEIREIVRG